MNEIEERLIFGHFSVLWPKVFPPYHSHSSPLHFRSGSCLGQKTETFRSLILQQMWNLLGQHFHSIHFRAEQWLIFDLCPLQVCALLKPRLNVTIEPTMQWDRIAAYALTEKREWMSMQNQQTIAYKVSHPFLRSLIGFSYWNLLKEGSIPIRASPSLSRVISH